MNKHHATELVAAQRTRVETALAALDAEIRDDGALQRQQTGEVAEAGSALDSAALAIGLAADLREQLAAVGRAEERIAQGTYGLSVESGAPIPDERLEVAPLAERTIEEQRRQERG